MKMSPQGPAQLAFDLPHRSAQGVEDFLVSACNAAAVAMIDRWPDWAHPAVVVVGPQGSGKSHLINVWRERSGAERLDARTLQEAAMHRLPSARALAVEDVDQGIGNEQVLFHLLNLARERGLFLLLTGRIPPGEWTVALPDLRSRLRALPIAEIATPDEPLLKALLVKLFGDRQLSVEPHVIAFLALHMERSAEAATRIVAEIDRLALMSHRRVTRALAADALARLGMRDPD